MLTVASVYWKGSFRGRENIYSKDWVDKLKNMVGRNLRREHRFVCLSNVDVPCERIPLVHDWPGWWSKIELFRPNLFEDRVLYLDLDLVVLNRLDPIVDFPAEFATLAQPQIGQFTNREGKIVVDRYNSSVMVFDAGVADCLYTDFTEEAMKTLRGDQDYITDSFSAMSVFRNDQDYIGHKLPDLKTFPKDWIKKLRYCPNGVPTPKMIIALCMMGGKAPLKNIDAARLYPWIKDVWK
jgi:hypothetical protein